MVVSIVISILTVIGIILSCIFKPSITIKKIHINLYWVIALVGALLLLATCTISFSELWNGLTTNEGINPIQILILFLSMSTISIFLDEVGFFSYLASAVIRKCKRNQIVIFSALYFLAAILTMFASNDIVILTLTPFIIFFCKNGKINPIPYLVAEFVAANTWSMMFIIGNPTNICLAAGSGISFIDYVKVMYLPTIGAGIVEFLLLLLIFRKALKEEINSVDIEQTKCNLLYTIIGLVVLITCTVLLIISSYINLPMYLVCAVSLGVLIIIVLLICLFRKEVPVDLGRSLKRAPWEIIPFILAMFTLVLSLNKYDVTKNICLFFGEQNTIYTYGYTSMLAANLVNNIPMSVLYKSVLSGLTGAPYKGAMYATVIGSNLGAFITPVGALAGIMWMGILKRYEIKFSFIDFIKYGALISVICATVAFLLLNVTL